MVDKPAYFNVKRHRFWDDRRFLVWVAGGAFCGVFLHPKEAGINAGDVVGSAFLLSDIVGLVILLILLPFALIWRSASKSREQANNERIKTLNPASYEFLRWDKSNFRLGANTIMRADFQEKQAWFPWRMPTQEMELHLSNGQTWKFSLGDRLEADQLKRELSEGGIVATWRENG